MKRVHACPNIKNLHPLQQAIANLARRAPVRFARFKRRWLFIVSLEPLSIAWQKVGSQDLELFEGDAAVAELNKISSEAFFEGFKSMYRRWERGRAW